MTFFTQISSVQLIRNTGVYVGTKMTNMTKLQTGRKIRGRGKPVNANAMKLSTASHILGAQIIRYTKERVLATWFHPWLTLRISLNQQQVEVGVGRAFLKVGYKHSSFDAFDFKFDFGLYISSHQFVIIYIQNAERPLAHQPIRFVLMTNASVSKRFYILEFFVLQLLCFH